MNKPHILHVISSLKLGGAELLLMDLVAGLQESYHQTIIYFHDGPIRAKLEAYNIKCIYISRFLCLYDPYFMYSLFMHVRRLRPTIIVSSLWSANFYARILGALFRIPTYTINHAQLNHEGPIRNALDTFTMHYAHKVIVVAPGIHQELLQKKWVPAEKIHTIVNGIHLHHISDKNVSRASLHLADIHFIVGAVGRFVPVKNFELLIETARHLVRDIPSIRLILIGVGPLEASLRELIDNYNLTNVVHILSEVNARDYYHLFDVFVQPSWSEGLSRALLEAFAHKVPVIASYNQRKEHDIIVHGHNGLLINPADHESLIHAIKQLYDSPDFCNQIATNGYETVSQHYSYEKMIKNYQAIFRKNS